MNHGLSTNTVDRIVGVLQHFPEVERAVLYGSRAKGNYRRASDIDLTLCGDLSGISLELPSYPLVNPFLPLQYLGAATGRIRFVETDEILGTRTNHMELQIDLKKLQRETGLQASTLAFDIGRNSLSADSWMARRSTAVDPEGTQTMIIGEAKLRRL